MTLWESGTLPGKLAARNETHPPFFAIPSISGEVDVATDSLTEMYAAG